MPHNLVKAVERAGVVGAGGAGFPTHIKLQSKVDTVIANGCECEPLLISDAWVMLNHPDEVVRGLSLAMKATGAKRGVLAVKEKNRKIIDVLENAIRPYPKMEIFRAGNFYPIGDEHVLTYEVTGKLIPIGGLPLDTGVLVQNVTTLANVAAASDGVPVTHKTITVLGEVANPGICEVPVGTRIDFIIKEAGGACVEPFFVIEGGPMMGKPAGAPVTKTTSALLILPASHPLVNRKIKPRKSPRDVCCNCSECSKICPRGLLGHPLYPHKIMRNMGPPDQQKLRHALLCSECALCEAYACTMDLSPMALNRDLKKSLTVSGIRYPGGDVPAVHPEWESMKVPTERLLMRLQLADYRLGNITSIKKITPARVEIPILQHIGAPARPVVSVGDKVNVGDLIAGGKGKISANIHASIAGRVESVDGGCIIIAL